MLDKSIKMRRYGALPQLDVLDRLAKRRGTQNVTFTAVGYGLQQSFPDAASWKENNQRVRMVAHPHLLQINTGFTGDFSLLLSNNANTGGTCFGDSGGPIFVSGTSTLVAVVSFGTSSTCSGTSGAYRIDQEDDLAFLASFGITP